MTTTTLDALSFSTPTIAGLLVAGVSLSAAAAVYVFGQAHTRAGWVVPGAGAGGPSSREDAPAHTNDSTDTRTQARARTGRGDGDGDKDKDEGRHAVEGAATTRKGRRRTKAKGVGGAEAEATVPFPRVVPGGLEDPGADVDASEASPAGAVTAPDVKTEEEKKNRRRKRKKQATTPQTQARERDEGDGGDRGAGLETGKEVDGGRAAARSGESTDASVSPRLSASGDTLPPSRATVARGSLGANTRLSLPSLSFDTDSSWTHVDRRRPKMSKSVDGHASGLPDAVDVTSSDLASGASDSPVAERMDSTMDVRGARADPSQYSLTERLVPRPSKTGADAILEQPTLVHAMRVQPRPEDTPVPGFSWEDYGDLVEDSVLVHDADEEDEGDWGVVKSRHRTRHSQTANTTATTTGSMSHAPTAPESMTKRQRQNARKRELAKAAKVETEAARLEGLAKHKRELERLRIIEQSRQSNGKLSGGMRATVDDQGKLVWE